MDVPIFTSIVFVLTFGHVMMNLFFIFYVFMYISLLCVQYIFGCTLSGHTESGWSNLSVCSDF